MYFHIGNNDYIKRIFEREGVVNWNGSTKWQATTLASMLENEKYKGDALLQKSYTADFLTKKRVMNEGEIQQFLSNSFAEVYRLGCAFRKGVKTAKKG